MNPYLFYFGLALPIGLALIFMALTFYWNAKAARIRRGTEKVNREIDSMLEDNNRMMSNIADMQNEMLKTIFAGPRRRT